MDKQNLLSGKVRVCALPVLHPPDGGMTDPRRIALDRGELAVLTDGKTSISHLAYVELKQQALRGNHFHKLRNEYFYMIAGEAELVVEDTTSKTRDKALIRAGDLVFITPGIAHAFVPLTPGHGIEFAHEPFDASDVYKYTVCSEPAKII
jgi:quercetin dioxygenase-like cupin family protein